MPFNSSLVPLEVLFQCPPVGAAIFEQILKGEEGAMRASQLMSLSKYAKKRRGKVTFPAMDSVIHLAPMKIPYSGWDKCVSYRMPQAISIAAS